MTRITFPTALALCLSLSALACSSSSTPSRSTQNQANAEEINEAFNKNDPDAPDSESVGAEVTENHIRDLVGADTNGYVDVDGQRCELAAFLMKPEDVDRFLATPEESGGSVVTDPTGSFGVYVIDTQNDSCVPYFEEALGKPREVGQ